MFKVNKRYRHCTAKDLDIVVTDYFNQGSDYLVVALFVKQLNRRYYANEYILILEENLSQWTEVEDSTQIKDSKPLI